MVNSVRSARESQSLTQEQLAGLVGVSRQSIISIEKGHYIPTTLLALKICAVLKMSVDDLFRLEKKDWV